MSAIDILNFYLDLRYDIRKNTNTKKTDRYWLVHKNVFESKEIAGKIRINIASFENGTPIRLNIIKLPEKNQGKN